MDKAEKGLVILAFGSWIGVGRNCWENKTAFVATGHFAFFFLQAGGQRNRILAIKGETSRLICIGTCTKPSCLRA